MEKMSKKILTFSFLMASLICFDVSATKCAGGGPGAASCSASTATEMAVAGTGGGFTYEASVTCRDGFYACCNSSATGASAKCIKN
jgi:hypothetical protein